jgi:hypothetical protein
MSGMMRLHVGHDALGDSQSGARNMKQQEHRQGKHGQETRERQDEPVTPSRRERPTIHFSQLPEDTSGGRTATEWNYSRREAGRLLGEGREGKWVLIKGEEIVGIWDTQAEVDQNRLQRFRMQDVLIQQIRTYEPLLTGPTYARRCRS